MRHLENPDAQVLGMIRTGYQAETQIIGAAQARNLRHIKAFSRKLEPREQFGYHMSQVLGKEIEAVDTGRYAVEGSDIVECLTTTSDPVLDGALLISAGPVTLDANEVYSASIERASLIAVDSPNQAQYESGDLVAAVDNGVISWDHVVQLSQMISGDVPGGKELWTMST